MEQQPFHLLQTEKRVPSALMEMLQIQLQMKGVSCLSDSPHFLFLSDVANSKITSLKISQIKSRRMELPYFCDI